LRKEVTKSGNAGGVRWKSKVLTLESIWPGMTNVLDRHAQACYRAITMRKYSTAQVAKMLKMHQPSLQRSIRRGTVKAPPLITVGGVKVRLWSPKDVERARKSLKRNKV